MAYQYPKPLQSLVNELSRLPGLGAKAAQRLAFHLLGAERGQALDLARAIAAARDQIHDCPLCGNFTDAARCAVCDDQNRDQTLLCVVEGVADLISVERAGHYAGLYHVLGGAISPLEGVGPEQLRISSLLQRVEDGSFREIIVATNPTVEGEATAMYLAKKLKPLNVLVSRIAHGLPVGGALAFTDEATLDLAISNRKQL